MLVPRERHQATHGQTGHWELGILKNAVWFYDGSPCLSKGLVAEVQAMSEGCMGAVW